MKRACAVVVLCLQVLFLAAAPLFADELATLTGYVSDPSGFRVPQCRVQVTNVATGVSYVGETNEVGLYRVPALPVGSYRVVVQKQGFKTIVKQGIELHVQDVMSLNFQMDVGSVSESVSVQGSAPLINTESAAVSTVVDRNFADNLPINGRSFQTLIQLTPGVVSTPSNQADSGQFSVNGQRAVSNYWMLDGVSANIGMGANYNSGNGLGGTVGSFSALGGTNSLVSVDALQEFRIQTSTYAPEFGRTPGAQISIVTRSGTNQLHGSLFDYLRNDAFDANNWFNTSVTPALPKPRERQNDFGGTLSGPILKDKTFFFLSYEGLRLRLPQTILANVPDLKARQSAVPEVQSYLKAYPLPNGPDDALTGMAQFNQSYSNPASLDAYSIRVDHMLNKVSTFARYNYSPSEIVQRGGSFGNALSVLQKSNITTHTATAGATWSFSQTGTNDLRVNYSRVTAAANLAMDNFGGAVPVDPLPFPAAFNGTNGEFIFSIFGLGPQNSLSVGRLAQNIQSQVNTVDNISVQLGSHNLKFGVDYRLLTPSRSPGVYVQQPAFLDVSSAENAQPFFVSVISARNSHILLQNLGSFAQDTWRISPRLALTYGVRWDIDFSPSTLNGPPLPAVTEYTLSSLSTLALAPAGSPPFNTRYGNLAPRVGLAYTASQSRGRETVIRGGFGVFYDLASSEVGGLIGNQYPFGASKLIFGPALGGSARFPLSASDAAPPAITTTQLSAVGAQFRALDPHLSLPYTLEWNIAVEQGVGQKQSISASYIGASGRRLLQSALLSSPNTTFNSVNLVSNTASSEYNALQVQFQRKLSAGLQALASYAWSHSLDDGSAGSSAILSNTIVPGLNANVNRGPSDFDVRHSFSAAATYELPALRKSKLLHPVLHGWSLHNMFQVRSGLPLNVFSRLFGAGKLFNAGTEVRPDVVPGIPLFLYGSQYPGGRSIDNTPGAVAGGCPDGSKSIGPFCPPPKDSQGNLLRQGNLGRNALRGFGAAQWDLAIHREFPIRESLQLQFRAEVFNVLNHPNFGQPDGNLADNTFGRSTQILSQSLNQSNSAGGAFNPLYQIGGPRSLQFALKIIF